MGSLKIIKLKLGIRLKIEALIVGLRLGVINLVLAYFLIQIFIKYLL